MSMENVLESLALKVGRAEVQNIILEQSLTAANEKASGLQNELNERDQTLQEQTVELEELRDRLAKLAPETVAGEVLEDFPEESNEAE